MSVRRAVRDDGPRTADAFDAAVIYGQRFSEGGSKQKISLNGGAQAQWRRDGRELFYVSLENTFMSVKVHRDSPRVFGPPERLLHISLHQTLVANRNVYAVSR
jgi:hypothetical protein